MIAARSGVGVNTSTSAPKRNNCRAASVTLSIGISAWLTMNGLGAVDDNVLNIPGGQYRAMGVRAFNPQTRQWLIWWVDGRNPATLDPPVAGSFENGVGTFIGNDTLRGRPIIVRYQWSEIAANSAHWEQAFSPDNGASWEVNWIVHSTRAQ